MVAKVYGYLDNQEMIFSYNETTGRWETTVPEHLDGGSYIVALYAEDEAGNRSYITTALCTLDTSRMCLSVEFSTCSARLLVNTCRLSVVRCDVCGRW